MGYPFVCGRLYSRNVGQSIDPCISVKAPNTYLQNTGLGFLDKDKEMIYIQETASIKQKQPKSTSLYDFWEFYVNAAYDCVEDLYHKLQFIKSHAISTPKDVDSYVKNYNTDKTYHLLKTLVGSRINRMSSKYYGFANGAKTAIDKLAPACLFTPESQILIAKQNEAIKFVDNISTNMAILDKVAKDLTILPYDEDDRKLKYENATKALSEINLSDFKTVTISDANKSISSFETDIADAFTKLRINIVNWWTFPTEMKEKIINALNTLQLRNSSEAYQIKQLLNDYLTTKGYDASKPDYMVPIIIGSVVGLCIINVL